MFASFPRVEDRITLRPSGLKRGEGHAGEGAEHFLLAGVEVEQIHPRLVPRIGHEGDLLGIRVEARGERGGGAIGQESLVLAVLVHDRQPPGAAIARPGLRHVDDAGIEIALLAQQPLIDHV